jgi:hypothetical protein
MEDQHLWASRVVKIEFSLWAIATETIVSDRLFWYQTFFEIVAD